MRIAWFAATLVLVVAVCEAAPPVTPPSFTHPLDITNPFHPFQPGAVKVFSGRTGRRRRSS
jgi:hypothetical protein